MHNLSIACPNRYPFGKEHFADLASFLPLNRAHTLVEAVLRDEIHQYASLGYKMTQATKPTERHLNIRLETFDERV